MATATGSAWPSYRQLCSRGDWRYCVPAVPRATARQRGRKQDEEPVNDVRIYQPSKTAMQSGRRNTHKWLLVFEPDGRRPIDPLMGWVGSEDTRSQLRLRFDSRDEAVAFAERNGLAYDVFEPQPVVARPKSYADKFRP